MQLVREKLQQSGFKLTMPREHIVEVLVLHQSELLSAEEVYLYTKERYTAIGLATVYRTLDLLSELSLVNRVLFSEGMTKYCLQLEKHAVEATVRCRTCGKIEQLPTEMMLQLQQTLGSRYVLTPQKVELIGLCDICRGRLS